jgi:hypothetical protein
LHYHDVPAHPLPVHTVLASDVYFTALAKSAISLHIRAMNGKQRKTLQSVFRDPVASGVGWDDIESLLIACGCSVVEGNGSRVRFEKDGIVASFHRPHPSKEAKKYQARMARAFLTEIGVKP